MTSWVLPPPGRTGSSTAGGAHPNKADRLTAAGVAVRWDDDLPGHRRCSADDPVGNRLEFLQPDAGVPAG